MDWIIIGLFILCIWWGGSLWGLWYIGFEYSSSGRRKVRGKSTGFDCPECNGSVVMVRGFFKKIYFCESCKFEGHNDKDGNLVLDKEPLHCDVCGATIRKEPDYPDLMGCPNEHVAFRGDMVG